MSTSILAMLDLQKQIFHNESGSPLVDILEVHLLEQGASPCRT